MEVVAAKVTDVAVLRRMLFATAYLPADIPNYWAIVARFACLHSPEKAGISPQVAQMTMENVQFLNKDAFCQDRVDKGTGYYGNWSIQAAMWNSPHPKAGDVSLVWWKASITK